jgi:hypothetical protein
LQSIKPSLSRLTPQLHIGIDAVAIASPAAAGAGSWVREATTEPYPKATIKEGGEE